MKQHLKVTEFHDHIGAGRRDIENWINRRDKIGLRTKYADTVSGSARPFTRANVLELASLAAFVKIGFAPSEAAAYADMVVRNSSSGHLKEWFVCRAGDFASGKGADDLTTVSFDEILARGETVPAFSVIRMGEIVRRVDALFTPETAAL